MCFLFFFYLSVSLFTLKYCLQLSLYTRPAEDKNTVYISTTYLPSRFHIFLSPTRLIAVTPTLYLSLTLSLSLTISHLFLLSSNLHSPGPAVTFLLLHLLLYALLHSCPPLLYTVSVAWPFCVSISLPTAAITIPPPTHSDISWHTRGQRAEAPHSLIQLLHLCILPAHSRPALCLFFFTRQSFHTNLKPPSCFIICTSFFFLFN